MSILPHPSAYPTPPPTATPPAATISITRCPKLEAEVYDFALTAYQLLFAPRSPNPSAIPADLAEFESIYCSPSSLGCFLVARDISPASNGQIVGIVGYRPFVHRFKDSQGRLRPEIGWEGRRTVEVVRLFMSPLYRGRGLAQRLILRLVEEARKDEVEVMYLHTQPFLPGAEKLWGKMGWELICRDTDQWESIHMVRKL